MSVVLAADSASTVSYYEGSETRQRYFKGANKVFQLSDSHPVGLMIYGNAEVLGVPWELVIKGFRKHLNNSSFDSIEGYAKAFQQFLDDNLQYFPTQSRDESFVDAIELETAISCRDFNTAAENDEGFDEAAQLAGLVQNVDVLDFDNGQDDDFLTNLLDQWPDEILARLRSENLAVYHPYLGERTDERLLEIIRATITLKAKQVPNSPTGLVFAGFGDSSIYPETYVAKDTGFIARRFVMANPSSTKISRNLSSHISGFAQSSMADTFIIGFDSDAYNTINQVQRQALPDVLDLFLRELGGKVERTAAGSLVKDAEDKILIDEQKFETMMHEALSPVGNQILQESRQKHGEPLERVISMLPIEEMAELAATMVDLQSLKEKVTRPSETVGGPVDVAIITKNEGLVWKKRKHFFDASINQRYLHRLHSQD
jgi:uncharacterized protein YjgD (DUF1641 family)